MSQYEADLDMSQPVGASAMVEPFSPRPRRIRSWRQSFDALRAKEADTSPITASEPAGFLDVEWEQKPGWGHDVGEPIEGTVWTKKRIYFLAEYDDSYYMSSVKRNPS